MLDFSQNNTEFPDEGHVFKQAARIILIEKENDFYF